MFARPEIGITRALACFMLLIVSGCNAPVQSANTVNSASNECPDKPEGSLDSDNVKSVSLGTQTVKESGMVSPGKYLGYTFEAKSGQKLSYRTSDNICTWVYTQDNQLLNSTELPQNGKYTIQVSALTGSTTFEIEMGLEETVEVFQPAVFQPEPTNSPTFQRYQQFSPSDFPKASCGDPLPSNSEDYPVTFYPVFVPYSDANLAKARSYFCEDSLKVRRETTKDLVVQVSSFTSEEKSIIFADFISSELPGATVGPPTILNQD